MAQPQTKPDPAKWTGEPDAVAPEALILALIILVAGFGLIGLATLH